jgi:hypothetical protein
VTRPRRIAYVLAAGVLCLCLYGCKIEGTIVDTAHVETQVTDMHLAGDREFTVLNGESMKNIPLEACVQINIYSDESRVVAGQLYYAASLELRDGTRMEKRSKTGTPLTFILVTNTLVGESHKSLVSVSLANISRIYFKVSQ